MSLHSEQANFIKPLSAAAKWCGCWMSPLPDDWLYTEAVLIFSSSILNSPLQLSWLSRFRRDISPRTKLSFISHNKCLIFWWWCSLLRSDYMLFYFCTLQHDSDDISKQIIEVLRYTQMATTTSILKHGLWVWDDNRFSYKCIVKMILTLVTDVL